jgi:hypothetical protein
MSDLEQRLAEALTQGAQGAPPATGLATAARARARAKRRTRIAGLAAVVALGVGVPTAVLATQGSGGGDDDGSGPVAGPTAIDTEGTRDPGLPNGYHYESLHDVTIEVPNTWGYGSLSSWCADGGSSDSYRIARPGEVTEAIACNPATGYGVEFSMIDNTDDFQWPLVRQKPGSGWPTGAYVGARGIGGVLVTVVARKSTVASYVLDSMRRNASLDPNGCPVDSSSDPVVPGDSMTVCRYDSTGLLEQSELLTGPDLDAAEAALQAAPASTPADCDAEPGQALRMASVAEDARIDLNCDTLTEHGAARQLTKDVLYWALSPGWSGSVPHGVSLPSELR